MRGLVVALTTTVVVLGSGAPSVAAVAGPTAQVVVPGTVLTPDPLPRPDEGCTLPVVSSLPSCPDPGSRRPPVGCVLPVGQGAPGTVEPDCAPDDPSPDSRVVPAVPPLSR